MNKNEICFGGYTPNGCFARWREVLAEVPLECEEWLRSSSKNDAKIEDIVLESLEYVIENEPKDEYENPRLELTLKPLIFF